MEVYRIGDIIREERVRQSITQEELSYGICSVPTLSRIENASQKPSMKIREALLERLGYGTGGLTVCVDDAELRKYFLENEIRVKGMHQENVENLIDEYKDLIATRSAEGKLEKQFIKMVETIVKMRSSSADLDSLSTDFIEAIKMTIPDFDIKKISKNILLTSTEMMILNNLTIIYALQKKYDVTIMILKHLILVKESRPNSVCGEQEGYAILVANLVKALMIMEDFEEVLKYSEKGIEYCIKQKSLQGLPELLYYNGRALLKKQRIEEGVDRYEQVVTLLKIEHNDQEALAIQDEIQDLKRKGII